MKILHTISKSTPAVIKHWNANGETVLVITETWTDVFPSRIVRNEDDIFEYEDGVILEAGSLTIVEPKHLYIAILDVARPCATKAQIKHFLKELTALR
jgi:2-C-methyl-D-erythritol 4-phosphate cytidylyltransferase